MHKDAVIGQKGTEGYRVLGYHILEHVFVEAGVLLFVVHRVIINSALRCPLSFSWGA